MTINSITDPPPGDRMRPTQGMILSKQLAAVLQRELAQPTPSAWRHGFSPAMSYGRHAGPPRHDARQAAVLLLLYPHEQQWYLPLTRRHERLAAHPGQVSLPGGAIEPEETPSMAALREAEEELGIDRRCAQIVGELSPIYIFNSNYRVTPCVAYLHRRPNFLLNTSEVAELIELPLSALEREDLTSQMAITRGGLSFTAPCLQWGSAPIWGATRVILGEFTRVLQAAWPN